MQALYVNSAQAADKRHFWERTINAAFGPVDMAIADESGFFAEMRSTPFGNLALTEVACASEMATRSRRHIAHDKVEAFVLVLQRSGRLTIEQCGRTCILTPGTFALFDLNSPYVFAHRERTEVLDLTIPGALLRARLRDPHALVARALSAETGVGRVTADFLISLAREMRGLPSPAAHAYCGRVIDIVGMLLEDAGADLPIASSAVRSALFRRCLAIIDANLGDPAFGPAEIAAAAGISLRYLHRIFQDAGHAVGSCLRERRLARCHDELADPAKRAVPVGEIAYRCGFRSQSHFANSFRRRYGLSPRDMRRVARG